MTQIREPAVAGTFYPEHPGALSSAVRSLLRKREVEAETAPRALIVPHAGYVYSGPVAAAAYASILPHRRSYRRVVLIGPAHRVAFDGLAVSAAEAFRTPLGDVPLDREAIRGIGHPAVRRLDEPHRPEHSLEVQLPFLQQVLGSFSLIPLVVGSARPETVADVIGPLWDEPESLLVVSSDLSHYLPYEEARRRDERTGQAIEAMDIDRIRPDDACGSTAICGLLIAARQRGLRTVLIDLRNSGDTSGGRDGVVGYGAWMITGEQP